MKARHERRVSKHSRASIYCYCFNKVSSCTMVDTVLAVWVTLSEVSPPNALEANSVLTKLLALAAVIKPAEEAMSPLVNDLR